MKVSITRAIMLYIAVIVLILITGNSRADNDFITVTYGDYTDTLQNIFAGERDFLIGHTLYIHSYHTVRINPLGQVYEVAYDSLYYTTIACDGWDTLNEEGHRCIVVIQSQG